MNYQERAIRRYVKELEETNDDMFIQRMLDDKKEGRVISEKNMAELINLRDSYMKKILRLKGSIKRAEEVYADSQKIVTTALTEPGTYLVDAVIEMSGCLKETLDNYIERNNKTVDYIHSIEYILKKEEKPIEHIKKELQESAEQKIKTSKPRALGLFEILDGQ